MFLAQPQATTVATVVAAAAPRRRFALGYGVVLALFATSPLWLSAVGLYQYLALEVMIWSCTRWATTCCSATAACRRSATARSSASARTRAGLCS